MRGNQVTQRIPPAAPTAARKRRLCVLAVAISAAYLALAAAPAFGALSHPLKANFGNVSNPVDIAVDKANGNVFVADVGFPGNTVQIFGPGGGPPIGVATTTIGGFNFRNERTALAVDNSPTSPSKGTLYVVDAGNQVVKKFTLNPLSEEYEQTGTLPGTGTSGVGETIGVAVDSKGNVFVSEYNNFEGTKEGTLVKFSSAGVELGRAHFSASSPTLKNAVSSLAFDSAGNLYARETFGTAIWKFTADGGGEIDPATSPTQILNNVSPSDIAIDQDTGTLYAAFEDHVSEYDLSSCQPQCALAREFGFGILQRAAGIGVSPIDGDIYVGDRGAHDVALFGAGLAIIPDPETGPTSAVTLSAATLNGAVSAAGGPDASCEFQYTPKASYETERFASASSAPCTGGPFTGSEKEAVHADLTGLAANTAYRYRLRADNVNGANFGAALTFATVGKPSVAAATVSLLSTEGATVEDLINPNGGPGAVQPTTYFLEYVSSQDFEASEYADAVKSPPGGEAIGSGITDVKVSQQLSGLTAGGSYHLRVVAENEAGQTIGPETIFATYPESPPSLGCGNEGLRQALGSSDLSDCRAYEQATPVFKNGAAPTWLPGRYQATSDGKGIAYLSHGGFPGTEGGQGFPSFFATRGADWSSQGVLPPGSVGAAAGVLGWSEDLSHAYLVQAPLPEEKLNLLERDSAGGALQTLAVEGTANLSSAYYYVGSARDGSAVFFESETPSKVFNAYVWDRASGAVKLAGALPGGLVPANGSQAGSNEAGSHGKQMLQAEHTVSDDGSSFFFTDAGTGQLYLRQNPAADEECADPSLACTIQVSRSQRTPVDPKGVKPARFWQATPDGSFAFFTSPGKLKNNATTGPNDEGNDLYRYEAESGGLLDLTPDSGDPAGANVQGVLGASEDGSYVYFAANGVLASGATAGDCKGPQSGSCNLYLWHEGTRTFVAPLTPGSDNTDWSTSAAARTSRLSADGQTLLFRSQGKLTAYDNRGTPEFYRYTASDGKILCVSCNPTGVAPLAVATLQSTPTGLGNLPPAPVLSRNLSADGTRVFFETPDKLVAADTNGDRGCPGIGASGGGPFACQDVYEWEAKGSGSCESEAQDGGCLYLISDGRSGEPAYFADADRSGANAFFLTDRPLVGQDKDQIRDIYDARVDGGIASQSPPLPGPPCEGDACKGAAGEAPATQAPGTARFSGPGTPAPCGHGKVRKHGRCVKKGASHRKKHHKKKHHKKRHPARKHG
jgi:hypothetical protein